MTNAAKGALLGAANGVLAILALFGVDFSTKTNALVILIVNAVLGGAIVATRRLSPKWQETINTVAEDAAKVVAAAEPIAEAAASKKATAKKAATKKAPKA